MLFSFKCYNSCIPFPSWINVVPDKTMSEIHIINPHFVLRILHSPISRNHNCLFDPLPFNWRIWCNMYVTYSSWIFNPKTTWFRYVEGRESVRMNFRASFPKKKGLFQFRITLLLCLPKTDELIFNSYHTSFILSPHNFEVSHASDCTILFSYFTRPDI